MNDQTPTPPLFLKAIEAVIEASEWIYEVDYDRMPDGWVRCVHCDGGGYFKTNGEPSKTNPPTHKDPCDWINAKSGIAELKTKFPLDEMTITVPVNDISDKYNLREHLGYGDFNGKKYNLSTLIPSRSPVVEFIEGKTYTVNIHEIIKTVCEAVDSLPEESE